jgi:Cu/Zn superoxide dismutase
LAQGVVGWQKDTSFPHYPQQPADAATGKEAVAILTPTANNVVKGVAIFRQKSPSDAVEVAIIAAGLVPNSVHGIHAHQFGVSA